MTAAPDQTLASAIAELDRRAVAAILADDPDVARVSIDGIQPLHLACLVVTCDLALPARDAGPAAHAIVDDLLAAGADPSAPGPDGSTPLHTAAFCGNEQLVGQLLAAGGDPEATIGGTEGATPLSFALFYGHRTTARLVAAAGRRPDDLRSAAGLDDVDRIGQLVRSDGSLDPMAGAGMAFTAPIDAFPPREGPIDDQLVLDESLTWASRNGSLAAMELLVSRGADVDANPYRGTPLLWAVYADHADVVRWLLGRGADADQRHDFGGAEHGRQATALHLAAQYGCVASIEALVEAGADRTVRDGAFDATPAEWAAHAGQGPEVLERLRT